MRKLCVMWQAVQHHMYIIHMGGRLHPRSHIHKWIYFVAQACRAQITADLSWLFTGTICTEKGTFKVREVHTVLDHCVLHQIKRTRTHCRHMSRPQESGNSSKVLGISFVRMPDVEWTDSPINIWQRLVIFPSVTNDWDPSFN